MKIPLIFALVFTLLAGSYKTPVEDTNTTTPSAPATEVVAADDATRAETNPEIAPQVAVVEAINTGDETIHPTAAPVAVVNAIDAAETVAEPPKAEETDKITAEEAKNIALLHTGLTEDKVRKLEVDQDRKRGKIKFEVEFHVEGFEYEYEIDAKSGKILTSEKDWDD